MTGSTFLDFARSPEQLDRRAKLQAVLDELAASQEFKPMTHPLDFLRPPRKIIARQIQELQLQKELEAQRARREVIARTALAGANASPEEVALFDRNADTPFPSQLGTTGASPTTDPAAAALDTQAELRNEELNRAAAGNAGQVAELERYQTMKNAGVDPADLATARLRSRQADEADLRFNALAQVLDDENIDSSFAADVANKKPVSPGKLVKVSRRDGSEVYYREYRTPGGVFYEPANDKTGRTLSVPASASDATTLQKDVGYIVKTLGISKEEALKIKLSLKTKTAEAAWADLVKKLSTSNYGRLARDPAKLDAEARKVWSVMRPGEEPPTTATTAPGASTSDNHGDVRGRAGKEGYTNLGRWIDGKGFEVFDNAGKLIGHYR